MNVVVGDGGNEEGVQRDFVGVQPAWSAYRDLAFGVASFEVLNTTYAHWLWTADNGTLIDEVSHCLMALSPSLHSVLMLTNGSRPSLWCTKLLGCACKALMHSVCWFTDCCRRWCLL